MYNKLGDYNIAIGYKALEKNDSIDDPIYGYQGHQNVAIGYLPLASNTRGYANVAVGNSVLKNNTTGGNNIAIGNFTLSENTSGSNNLGVGYANLGENTSGYANIAIGYYALEKNTTGHHNIAIGDFACNSITTGSYKTCIGPRSGPVGIDAAAEWTNDDKIIYLGDRDTLVRIAGNLEVKGTFTAPQSSDRRLKNIKGENKSGLSQVRELKVYDYTFKNDKEHKPQVGVIAQDLEKVFPNAVTKDDEGYLRIRRDDIFYAMVNAIKQLDTIVQNLISDVKTAILRLDNYDKEIKALKKENKALRAKNEELEKRIERLEKLF